MRQLTESELEVASGALYESVDNSCFFSAAGAVASAFLGPGAAFVGVSWSNWGLHILFSLIW